MELIQLIDVNCGVVVYLCEATQPFDFIKPNVIRKFGIKLKYISQINGGLIMFFRKFENIF